MVSRIVVARPSASPPATHAGLSISPAELCATYTVAGVTAVRRIPLEPLSSEGTAGWPSLVKAFAELGEQLGGASVSIALMPPITEVRSVTLPPLRDEDAERLLARGAAKYFVTARQPQIIGVVRRSKRSRQAGPVIVAATAARLITTLLAAARDANLTVDGIGPAESAWAAAAASTWPAFGRGVAAVLVMQLDRTDLLRVVDGRLDGLRRFRAGAADVDLIADVVRSDPGPGGSNRIAVIGTHDVRATVVRALSERGFPVSAPADSRTDSRDASWSADLVAARFAAPRAGPLFRTEDVRATYLRDAWRTTGIVAGAAAALFIIAAALELWGVHRRLRATETERATLASQLSTTLIGRNSVETVYRHLATLTTAQQHVPEWSRTIAQLSEALPDGAYLTALHTRADSLIVDGLAEQATDAFNAIEQVPGLANVRSAAPVRRELEGDTTALERFTIAARVLTP